MTLQMIVCGGTEAAHTCVQQTTVCQLQSLSEVQERFIPVPPAPPVLLPLPAAPPEPLPAPAAQGAVFVAVLPIQARDK